MTWHRIAPGDHRADGDGYTLVVRRERRGSWRAKVRVAGVRWIQVYTWRLLSQAKRAAEDALLALRTSTGSAPIGWVRP